MLYIRIDTINATGYIVIISLSKFLTLSKMKLIQLKIVMLFQGKLDFFNFVVLGENMIKFLNPRIWHHEDMSHAR